MDHCLTFWEVLRFYFGNGVGNLFCESVLDQPLRYFSLSLLAYLKLFGWTLILEVPFYYLGFHWLLPQWSVVRKIFLIIGLNLLTHPIVCFGVPLIGGALGWNYAQYLVTSEIFAPMAEGFALAVIAKKSRTKAFGLAILANLVSWNLGVLIS